MDKLMRALLFCAAGLLRFAGLSMAAEFLAVTRNGRAAVARLRLVYDGGWVAASDVSVRWLAKNFTRNTHGLLLKRRMQPIMKLFVSFGG